VACDSVVSRATAPPNNAVPPSPRNSLRFTTPSVVDASVTLDAKSSHGRIKTYKSGETLAEADGFSKLEDACESA
jgi:hypothetical protein